MTKQFTPDLKLKAVNYYQPQPPAQRQANTAQPVKAPVVPSARLSVLSNYKSAHGGSKNGIWLKFLSICPKVYNK